MFLATVIVDDENGIRIHQEHLQTKTFVKKPYENELISLEKPMCHAKVTKVTESSDGNTVYVKQESLWERKARTHVHGSPVTWI